MGQKIKNPYYRKFLDGGFIDILTDAQIQSVLDKVHWRRREARAMLIMMYYSGARPAEVLRLRARDIYKEKNTVFVRMPAVKRGKQRTLAFPHKYPMVKELWDYIKHLPPDMLLYGNFVNQYERKITTKKGETKTHMEVSDKLRYHFKKWFNGIFGDGSITPYYLRHNRFSKFAASGASPQEMKTWKGCKSIESIDPYIHMSTYQAKKLSKLL